MEDSKKSAIKEKVKNHYSGLISNSNKEPASCCSPSSETASCCGPESATVTTLISGWAESIGYDKKDLSDLPEEAVGNTFGCGTPLANTEIKEGDVVLDLGSGAGLDILLASKQVGKTGKAIGLDMTPEMIEKATENTHKMGVDNVEFRLGEMENMPIDDNSVNLVISNCVINLSPDKPQVFKETFRVLKPGGKLVVSDIVADGLSDELKNDLSAWVSCVAGALSEKEYLLAIEDAGFEKVEVLNRAFMNEEIISQTGFKFDGKIASIKVKAIKS